mgnify:CR=1 FL=1
MPPELYSDLLYISDERNQLQLHEGPQTLTAPCEYEQRMFRVFRALAPNCMLRHFSWRAEQVARQKNEGITSLEDDISDLEDENYYLKNKERAVSRTRSNISRKRTTIS